MATVFRICVYDPGNKKADGVGILVGNDDDTGEYVVQAVELTQVTLRKITKAVFKKDLAKTQDGGDLIRLVEEAFKKGLPRQANPLTT